MADPKQIINRLAAQERRELEQSITQYTWWQSKAGRLFVIVWISLVNDESLDVINKFYPDTIGLLERGKAETEKVRWLHFFDLVQKGNMVKIDNPA